MVSAKIVGTFARPANPPGMQKAHLNVGTSGAAGRGEWPLGCARGKRVMSGKRQMEGALSDPVGIFDWQAPFEAQGKPVSSARAMRRPGPWGGPTMAKACFAFR